MKWFGDLGVNIGDLNAIYDSLETSSVQTHRNDCFLINVFVGLKLARKGGLLILKFNFGFSCLSNQGFTVE